ncbi:MAG: nitroreductase family deazaflavin-dependent oxidoreductase [Myxococcota bacterium]
MSDRLVLWLSTNAVITWVIRNIASHLDPILFKASNGRFFSMGAPSMPMVTLTTTGRRSGKPRAVHLACIPHEGDYLVVASAMGQERHPGWRYNLEAQPEVDCQMRGERYRARASVLSDAEKTTVWDAIRETIPQIRVYEQRTDRNIRVFRLRRIET